MKTKSYIIFIVPIFAALLFSCSGSYIFAAIENEVKLKDASAKGTIRDVIKIGTTLYASNGTVLEKAEFSEGGWSTLSSPASGLCTGIAGDGTNLYASFIDKYNNDGKGIWKYDSGSWTKVPGSDGLQYVIGSGTVLGLSNIIASSDGLTINSQSYTIYLLKSGSFEKLSEVSGKQVAHITAAGGTYYATSEKLFNNGVEVSGAPAGIRAIDPLGIYCATDTQLYKIGDWSASCEHGITAPTDLAVITLKGETHVLISSAKGGYGEVIVDTSNITQSHTVAAGSSDSTTPPKLLDQYNASIGHYPVGCIYADSDGTNYYVYLGINDGNYAKYSGLWGLYNGKEWNRE